jgi:hypothetical protein
MKVRNVAGVPGVTTEAEGLSLRHGRAHRDQRSVVGDMSVKSRTAVGVFDHDIVVGCCDANLTIEVGFFYRYDNAASRGHE